MICKKPVRLNEMILQVFLYHNMKICQGCGFALHMQHDLDGFAFEGKNALIGTL